MCLVASDVFTNIFLILSKSLGTLKHNPKYLYVSCKERNYKSVKSEHLNFQLGISMTQVAS